MRPTPLEHRDNEALRALLKQHANVNAAQPDGTTALHWAAHWNDLETVNLLLRAGADAEGRQPLRRDSAFRSRGPRETPPSSRRCSRPAPIRRP